MVNPNQKIFPSGLRKLLAIIFASITFNYFAPVAVKDLWYFIVLYLYYNSKDEPFWLAFFLILNDGFASFFGYRGANIDIIPFLPQFEVSHLYVLIAIYKAFVSKIKVPIFYSRFLLIMFIYMMFLYLYGLIQGIPSDYNIHLRNIRNIFPLFLIYTTPKLLKDPVDFERFFSFIFLIAILAFLTQIFSIIIGESPMVFFGISEGRRLVVSEEVTYRGFYNVMATFLSFFAAMFYLAVKNPSFNRKYLYIVLIATIGTTFLSATRGWILGLGFSFLLFLIIANRFSMKKIVKLVMPVIIILILGFLQPKINQQIKNAYNRFMTVESVLEGDPSVVRSASRSTDLSLLLISKWKEHPIIGWGYSDTFYKNQNGHLGNENLLFHSGVIGAGLLIVFFLYFILRLIRLAGYSGLYNPYGRAFLVFPIVLIGMFIMHSTSGQQFGYLIAYYVAFSQAVFFGFGAVVYNHVVGLKRLSEFHSSLKKE